jgi:hypothetical protein
MTSVLWRQITLKIGLLAIFTCSAFFFQSCGYSLGSNHISRSYRSITVPYPKGDLEGNLTAEIAYAISKYSPMEYKRCGGDLVLNVEILALNHDEIGFRYDRKESDNDKSIIRDRLVPTEERMRALFSITLYDPVAGIILIGPVQLEASADFDHDYYVTKQQPTQISLGQLDDVDVAREIGSKALDKAIAKRIADYITYDF